MAIDPYRGVLLARQRQMQLAVHDLRRDATDL
jgi:hypothetical protein